ncbi:MAG: retinol dehydrogenase-12 [Polyangiales bacterium]|jgi:retinol dehydrogenase-12
MHTSVVTGASAGIGFETAKALAMRGHRLLLVGRNPERTEASKAAIIANTGNVHVQSFLSDFSSLESVRALAAALREASPRIDTLVNNAGLWHQDRKVSKDGFEDTYAVNHLAPFLLTHLLIPSLVHEDHARIVFVSSRLHEEAGAFDFEDLSVETKPYVGLDVYARTKLANVLTANEFARRLAKTQPQITSSSVHPGAVQTSIVRDNPFLKIGIKFAGPFLRSAKEGAATSIYAATHSALQRVSGAYYSDVRQVPPSPHARDAGAAQRLWDLSLEQTGLTARDVHESVSVAP